jgi:hypothetical protein
MRFARRARSRFPDEAGNDETGAGKKRPLRIGDQASMGGDIRPH